jgi:hypothetical protein
MTLGSGAFLYPGQTRVGIVAFVNASETPGDRQAKEERGD